MATSYIGKPISLISHSDVRYRGILAGIDPVASTIQLSNVFSMGTESRRPPEEFIPPVQEPYQYIIFRASEVKDLAVDEIAAQAPPRQRTVHDDPAVIGASAPAPQAPAANAPSFGYQNVPQQQGGYVTGGIAQQQPQGRAPAANQQAAQSQMQGQNGRPQGQRSRRANSVQNATASLETVERAIGEMRITNQTAPNSRPRRGGGTQNHEIKVPTTDFDFQSSNAKFEKKKATPEEEAASGANDNRDDEAQEKGAYNPQKSFFDSLSSASNTPRGGGGGGGAAPGGGGMGGRGRGGHGGRNRREEERERNVATFGEPGGVGLLGPGAYVGGWGGYGRNGRRGRGRGGQPSHIVAARS